MFSLLFYENGTGIVLEEANRSQQMPQDMPQNDQNTLFIPCLLKQTNT